MTGGHRVDPAVPLLMIAMLALLTLASIGLVAPTNANDANATLAVSEPTLVIDETTELVATLTENNTTTNVTSETTFTSANASVATVENATVTATGIGTTTITATYQNQSTNGSIAVVDRPDGVPHSIYGSVTLNGDRAPPETTVTATMSGDERGSIEVTNGGVFGGPGHFDRRLLVRGSEADHNETVAFHIDPPKAYGLEPGTATETINFTEGELTELNLSATVNQTAEPTYATTITNDGGIATIGIPGPTNATIRDLFPAGLDGVNRFYHYTNETWESVIDLDQGLGALDTLVITTTGSGPSSIHVSIPIEPNTTAETVTLESGWNLVAAPTRVSAENAFGGSDRLLVLSRYGIPAAPDGAPIEGFDTYVIGSTAWNASSPTVEPFAGYFVYDTESVDLTPTVNSVSDRSTTDVALGFDSD